MRVDLLVSERDEREHRFVRLALLRRRRVRRAGRFPRRDHAELVFQLQDNSFRRFLPESADFRERRDIRAFTTALLKLLTLIPLKTARASFGPIPLT